MLTYFAYEKKRVERERIAEVGKAVGKPRVGGKFELVDHEGRAFGDEDMKGGFTLVRFSLFLPFFFWVERGGRCFNACGILEGVWKTKLEGKIWIMMEAIEHER